MQAIHEKVRLGRSVTRRRFLHGVSAGALAAGTLSLRDVMTVNASELKRQGRSMILLWMGGGPSQFESFDPKTGSTSGGTKSISTATTGVRIAERWDRTAAITNELAIIRSMSNREGSHPRATYQLHTCYIPSGSVKHPSLSANIAQQIADPQLDLPSVVTVGGARGLGGTGAGFLGVDFEPFVVTRPGSMPDNVTLPTSESRFQRRLGLLGRLENEFAERGAKAVVDSHQQIYKKTAQLVVSEDTSAFDISSESAELKSRYGNTNFGRGCLLARRLVEKGVTFVEVVLGGWDTHQDNYERTGGLISQADPALATLIEDLKDRGLLETTLVCWMGEFGRTPRINPRSGRDHYPRAFNAVLAGAGVKGGQVIGSTNKDGSAVANRPVSVNDLFCSICHALKVDPSHENISPLGRPMKVVDGGSQVDELFS